MVSTAFEGGVCVPLTLGGTESAGPEGWRGLGDV